MDLIDASLVPAAQNASCPVCVSSVPGATTKWHYKTWEIKECLKCGLQFAWPFTVGNVEYYQEFGTYKKMRFDVENNIVHPGNVRIADKIKLAIQSYSGKPTADIGVLDYGCGSGYFGAKCSEQGCRVVCVDFNPEMVEIAKQCYGLTAFVKTSDELLEEESRFDVVILNHVLEHLNDPLGLLKKMRSLLNANGIIFISLPNREFIRERRGMVAGLLPDGHYPPHHVTFWSSGSLSAALTAAGFENMECNAECYPLKDSAEFSIKRMFGSLGGLSGLLADVCIAFGKALKLSGPNLIAVGRVRD